MTDSRDSKPPATEPAEGEDKAPWEPPTIVSFGTVRDMTAGVSFLLGDGLSNLS